MNLGSAVRWARRNWISCLLTAAIIGALNWGPEGEASSKESAAEPAAAPPPPRSAGPEEAARQQELREALDGAIYRNLVRERERLTEKSVIATQLEVLEETADPYEYAARLCALGNLYQQKRGDFETAAGYYELLIEDYPDWPGIASAYHQLMACYTQLNEPQELRILHHKMLEVFPEGSVEHEYAKAAIER